MISHPNLKRTVMSDKVMYHKSDTNAEVLARCYDGRLFDADRSTEIFIILSSGYVYDSHLDVTIYRHGDTRS